MCGIIGYCGPKKASEVLLEGLKRLEYRGYDSAGICIGKQNKLEMVKKKGKINDLRRHVPKKMNGFYGIGHTRWATHGEVTDENAHPHLNCKGDIAVVHNGIIENFNALREKLKNEGHTFTSDTDSEIIAHVISTFYKDDLVEAVRNAVSLLEGTFGIACIHADKPDHIVGARNGSPLVIGIGQNEMFLASDVTAMIAHTKQVVYIEDREIVSITPDTYSTIDLDEHVVNKKIENITWELEEIEKGDFESFMEKEIFEQPESIERAFRGRIEKPFGTAKLGGLHMNSKDLYKVERVKIIAAGTSFHAGMVGAYLLETLARVPAVAELASEVRYRNPIVEPNTIYFAISQSGETADTLYAMRELQRKGATVMGICNVVGSTIPRESDGGVYLHSGPEISVASTKAFTSQLTVLYLFTLLLARIKDLSLAIGSAIIRDLDEITGKIDKVLEQNDDIRKLAKKYAKYPDFLFLGRGINYPVALEGALKLKEISYIHAEGYSAAEIKHGPIALINEETPSMFLIPDDMLRDKVLTNMKEVKARKGKVIAVAVEGDTEVAEIADDVVYVPKVHELLYPYLMVLPLQLFAYHCARELGRNVDQPRNLAKSVTVE